VQPRQRAFFTGATKNFSGQVDGANTAAGRTWLYNDLNRVRRGYEYSPDNGTAMGRARPSDSEGKSPPSD
ncbi:MAG: hypothetical protein ACI3W5_17805, partial [Faecousia sp.]